MNLIEAVTKLRNKECAAIVSASSITEYIGLGQETPDINFIKLVNTRDGRAFEFDIIDILIEDWKCSKFRTYQEYYDSI